MVTKAAVADVFVFDGAEGILLEVKPDVRTWPRIRTAWDEFMQFVAKTEAPPLTERDVHVRDDPEWIASAATYVEAKRAADTAAKTLDAVKAKLIRLASHTSESGGGVSVTRYWKTGAIDYTKMPELVGVDLEQYRGSEREETRVTVLR